MVVQIQAYGHFFQEYTDQIEVRVIGHEPFRDRPVMNIYYVVLSTDGGVVLMFLCDPSKGSHFRN